MLTELFPGTESRRATPVASGLRFHLAEDRIREFLMGDNLYGEPSLALRELYQNALDACRLSRAREEFLKRPHAESTADRPSIEFEQGIDTSGRGYIDCVDRGAGMGLDELLNAFCQAGVRASDLAARVEENNDFAAADPPVELWQNSRFGIGVMSYFMVAEAVTVTTVRLNRDGSIGDLLQMHIPGPAEAFDVVSLGPGRVHGTRVRLWLKPSLTVSAVSTLRDLVLVCPLHMRVADQRGLEHRWLPDELNRGSSELGDVDRMAPAGNGLWWAPERGAVLADGIWVNSRITGMVVNLRGPVAPVLTADRQRVVHLDSDVVDAVAEASAAESVRNAWNIVGEPEWLARMSLSSPLISDVIVRAGSLADKHAQLHTFGYSIRAAGLVSGDDLDSVGQDEGSVIAWRFSRMRAAGLYRSLGVSSESDVDVEPARPSDAVLLGLVDFVYRDGRDLLTSGWTATAAAVYDAERILGYSVPEIVSRAEALGLDLPADSLTLPPSTPTVRTALSFSRRQNADGTVRPISAFDVLQTSWALGVPAREIVLDLAHRRIAYDDRADSLESSPIPTEVLIAISRNGDGIAPWLTSTEEVPLKNVVFAARAATTSPESIIAHLSEWGFPRVPALPPRHPEITDDDLLMLSVDLDSAPPYFGPSRPASRRKVKKAAERLRTTRTEVMDRLAEFGVLVVDEPWRDPQAPRTKKQTLRLLGFRTKAERSTITRQRLKLMSRDGDALAPWFDPARPIPAWQVATQALHGRSIDKVLDAYRELGYTAEDPRTAPVTRRPGRNTVARRG